MKRAAGYEGLPHQDIMPAFKVPQAFVESQITSVHWEREKKRKTESEQRQEQRGIAQPGKNSYGY